MTPVGTTHPRLEALRGGELHAQLEACCVEHQCCFTAEMPATELQAVRELLAELHLCMTAERSLESPHARTKRTTQHARHHTECYISIEHRWEYMENDIVRDFSNSIKIADRIAGLPTAARMIESLGLASHPLVNHGKLRNVNTKLARRIIYNSDAWALYTWTPPVLTLHPGDDKDKPAPPAPACPVEAAGRSMALKHVQHFFRGVDDGDKRFLSLSIEAGDK